MSDLFRFFKFRDINKRSIESLIKGTVYFSPIEKLNDPFDCKLDIKKAIDNVTSKLEKEYLDRFADSNILEKFYEKVREIGICSFSLELLNTLLWSHYSNNHKGISILYEFPEHFLNDGERFIGISEVSYGENSLTNWFENNLDIKNNQRELEKDSFLEMIKIYFTFKSPEWWYEKEVRIIRPKHGILGIDKTYIKQICFGLNTSEDDIELIREIINNYDHKVDLCRIIRTDKDFGIDVGELK
jgi:hypothetical protein